MCCIDNFRRATCARARLSQRQGGIQRVRESGRKKGRRAETQGQEGRRAETQGVRAGRKEGRKLGSQEGIRAVGQRGRKEGRQDGTSSTFGGFRLTHS